MQTRAHVSITEWPYHLPRYFSFHMMNIPYEMKTTLEDTWVLWTSNDIGIVDSSTMNVCNNMDVFFLFNRYINCYSWSVFSSCKDKIIQLHERWKTNRWWLIYHEIDFWHSGIHWSRKKNNKIECTHTHAHSIERSYLVVMENIIRHEKITSWCNGTMKRLL